MLPTGIKIQLYKTSILPIIDNMDIVYHNFGIHGKNKMMKNYKNYITFVLGLFHM